MMEGYCCMKAEGKIGTIMSGRLRCKNDQKVDEREMCMDGNGGPEEHNAAWRSDGIMAEKYHEGRRRP